VGSASPTGFPKPQPVAVGRRRSWRWLAGFLLIAAAAFVTHPYWLRGLGWLLINDEPPVKTELMLVLAGDWLGGRVLKAGELVKQGYAPRALLSSPVHHYGVPEGELAIRFAERRGYDASLFEPFVIKGNSTEEEAIELLAEARRRGVHRVLIVTSDFHTRRARRIYNALRGDIDIHLASAPHAHFRADSWWKTREGRKTWLLEFTKLVTGMVGM
jgi:uncharacterized SAM-binding protein YcdF (DUF218 family)